MKYLFLLPIIFILYSFTFVMVTKASYYGQRFHGKTTANGERFNMNAMTAAHKELPFGTIVEVTNLRNNKCVSVRINDRGPYIKGRTFDLSRGAFKEIANIDRGVINIKYEIIK